MNYDFSGFHKGHNLTVVAAPDGVHVVCLTCGVSGNMEAISAKVSPADVCKLTPAERVSIDDQSTGVDRGAAK